MQQNNKWPSKLLGPAFVGLAYVLIAGVAYVHFRVLLPHAAAATDSEATSLSSALHYCVSVFLLAELLAQYSLAVWTDPGYVRDSIGAVEAEHKSSSTGEYDAASRFCKKCADVKPRRAHHCRECARCVHEMDHHCPWVNNCVGYNNHRFFWLVLFYLWVCCAYVSILSSEPFFKVLQARKHRSAPPLPLEKRMHNVAISFSFLLTTTLGVVLFGYWLWHSFLALTQQTTIEFAGQLRDQESGNRHGATMNAPRGNRQHSKLRLRNLQRMLRRNDRFWLLALVLPPLPPTMKTAVHLLVAKNDEDTKRWSV